MEIALYHTTLPEPNRKPGGVEIVVNYLANELAKNKEDKVIVFSLSPCPKDALYKHVQLFPHAKCLRQNRLLQLLLLPFLMNFVTFKNFDVLHLHGDDWFFIKRSLPTIRTLHGSALREAQYATSLKRKISQYMVYFLEYLSTKLATMPLAIGLDTSKLCNIKHIVDNGVNIKEFYPGKKSKDPSILFVGTWEGRKRGKFIFNVFIKKVLPKIPKAKLYMVTDLCSQHKNVIYAKYPNNNYLAKLYRKAWVFAYPSVYEGFGIPYVEALASGTAILSSYNQGAEYILQNGKYGIITSDESFGDELINLIKNTKKRGLLEINGIKRAKKFDWKNIADRHRELYTKTIEKWKRLQSK